MCHLFPRVMDFFLSFFVSHYTFDQKGSFMNFLCPPFIGVGGNGRGYKRVQDFLVM